MIYQGKDRYLDGYDALKAMCEGYTGDQIAFFLIDTNGMWRTKTLPTGSSRVRACLSPEKNEYFSLGEIIAIMQFTGRFDPVYFICDVFGMTRPVAKSPEEQIAHLTGVMESANETMMAAHRLIEGLVSRQPGSASNTDEHIGKFCLDSKDSHIGRNF